MSYRRGQYFLKEANLSCCSRLLNIKSVNSYVPVTCVYQPLFATQKWKTTLIAPNIHKPSIVRKVIKKLGWFDISRSKLKRSGYYLYENVADKVNYLPFFKEFDMEDSFFSWYLITELHVWMILVRVMAEAEEGRFVRNNVVEAMWADVSTRGKKLSLSTTHLGSNLSELSEQFQAAIIGYDEGLLSDDRVLAGAVWRRFFNQNCTDPQKVEHMVQYIRKQVRSLDQFTKENVLNSPNIKWIPLDSIQKETF